MKTPLLFLDLEGSGVNPTDTPDDVARQDIFEIAVICMSEDLEREFFRFSTVIRPTAEGLARLHDNAFVLDMHMTSGLYAELTSENASDLPTLADTERAILALMDAVLPKNAKVTIAGSGVARYDALQVKQQMRDLAARLTYDEQDVSSARKRFHAVTGAPIVTPLARKAHRALADIEDDIRHVRAFDAIFRHAAAPNTTDPVGRQMLALALTEQYMLDDAHLNSDGSESPAVHAPKVISSLLDGVPTIEVVLGYMSVTHGLLNLLSEMAGCHPDTSLKILREMLVQA